MQREQLRTKYRGTIADDYDSARARTELWENQQRAVEDYLAAFPAGTRVLDVPVGTGRFLQSYEERDFDAVGVDASGAMLEKARAKAGRIDLRVGNAFELEFSDASFDLVVCIRFFNWLSGPDFQRAFAELARVARGAMIANVKTFTPHAELEPLQALRQWKFRARSALVRGTGLVIHERRLIQSLIRRHGLALERITSTEPPYELRAGIENHVYLLRKTTSGGRDHRR